MRYSVTLKRAETRDVEVEADSPEEAIKKVRAMETLPRGMFVDSVDEHGGPKAWDHIARCEKCRAEILDGLTEGSHSTPHAVSEDGQYFCKPCAEAIEESGTWPKPDPH